jgi:hypothetical protein
MMEQIIYSKKSIGLGIIIWGAILIPFALMIRFQIWVSLVIFLPFILFIVSIWFGTKYTLIDNQFLKIQCGLIHFETIEVSKINVIEKLRSFMSAPANSLDRIEITYKNYCSVVISPPDKVAFVKMLLEIKPKIKTNIV